MSVLEVSPIGAEALDQSVDPPPAIVRATLRDIALSNTLFGGRQAVRYGVRRLLRQLPRVADITLLDIGAGMGDIPEYLTALSNRGRTIRPIAVERNRVACGLCLHRGIPSVVADGGTLPLRDGSVDIAIASQVLHHFSRKTSVVLIKEMCRVSRIGVVISDVRRQWVAAAGIWLASVLLRFHEVTRRDAVISVRRGFKTRELGAILTEAGIATRVYRRPGFRLVAAWTRPDAHT